MKPVHFRGVNYDPVLLSRLAMQGHRETVATKDISDLVAYKNAETRIAVKVDQTYHLLTGAIDKAQPAQHLIVVTTFTLKKAAAPALSYTERQELKRQESLRDDKGRWGAHLQDQRYSR